MSNKKIYLKWSLDWSKKAKNLAKSGNAAGAAYNAQMAAHYANKANEVAA